MESTLSLTFDSLRQQVALELGFGTTIANWSADQSAALDRFVRSGLAQFYTPPPLQPGRPAHAWSFLRPLTTLIAFAPVAALASLTITGVVAGGNTTLTASSAVFVPSMAGGAALGAVLTPHGVGDTATYRILSYTSPTVVVVEGSLPSPTTPRTFSIASTGSYPLPDEFGGLEGDLSIETPEISDLPIRHTAESIIRQLRITHPVAGRPSLAAVVPIVIAEPNTSIGAGQRWQLHVHPTPDVHYTLRLRFCVLPDQISANNFYPYGGAAHAETILASCLDVAAQRLNKDQSLHPRFLERLAASISFDLQHAPQRLGFSQEEPVRASRLISVQYNGVALG